MYNLIPFLLGLFVNISLRLIGTHYKYFSMSQWARGLVVSDLRSEVNGSQFEFGDQLCAEVSSLH